MSVPLLMSRVLLGCCGVVHPFRHQPPAVSCQLHAPCDLESIRIDRQLMAAKPAGHQVTLRIALSAPGEPPFKNLAAVLQLSKEGICCFPVSAALNPSSSSEGLVHKRERVLLL